MGDIGDTSEHEAHVPDVQTKSQHVGEQHYKDWPNAAAVRLQPLDGKDNTLISAVQRQWRHQEQDRAQCVWRYSRLCRRCSLQNWTRILQSPTL